MTKKLDLDILTHKKQKNSKKILKEKKTKRREKERSMEKLN